MAFLNGVHHVAYRCKNAKATVEWYQKYLDANFILAIAENQVPSTKEPDPYMHIFIDIGGGNILAFFELPTKPEMIAPSDANTPSWTQHLALKVDSIETMMKVKARMEADGIQVIGPTNHTIFQSIYFRDPSGHRLELAVNTATTSGIAPRRRPPTRAGCTMARAASDRTDSLRVNHRDRKTP